MAWRNNRSDALLELGLIEDKTAGDATINLTIDAGRVGVPLLPLDKARAALENLKKEN